MFKKLEIGIIVPKNEEDLCDDLTSFDLIENKGIYFYYAFLFVVKTAGRFDEFIDNLYVVPKKKKKLLEE